jgi:hypothetical protein
MALLVGARVSGPVATLLFVLLLRRRIRMENMALVDRINNRCRT